jgi:hypothetical protein
MPKYKVVQARIDPKDSVVISTANNKNVVTQASFNLSYKDKEENIGQVLKLEGHFES